MSERPAEDYKNHFARLTHLGDGSAVYVHPDVVVHVVPHPCSDFDGSLVTIRDADNYHPGSGPTVGVAEDTDTVMERLARAAGEKQLT